MFFVCILYWFPLASSAFSNFVQNFYTVCPVFAFYFIFSTFILFVCNPTRPNTVIQFTSSSNDLFKCWDVRSYIRKAAKGDWAKNFADIVKWKCTLNVIIKENVLLIVFPQIFFHAILNMPILWSTIPNRTNFPIISFFALISQFEISHFEKTLWPFKGILGS